MTRYDPQSARKIRAGHVVRFAAISLLALEMPAFSVQPAADAALREKKPQSFAREARALIQRYVDDGRFSGSVLVAVDGKPILGQGFGYADRDSRLPATSETVYRIGSITKLYTSIAVMQLVEQGKLQLDDPVGKYYEGAPAAWNEVTVRYLLGHRSGIFNLTVTPGFAALLPKQPSPRQQIDLVRDMPLDFAPGKKFAYGNTGAIILGCIIEKVSGESYGDYLERHIINPLSMRRTGYDYFSAAVRDLTTGYFIHGNEWKIAPSVPTSVLFSAGAVYSTVSDMLLLDQALYTDKLLSKASRDAMFLDPEGDSYGFGIFSGDFHGHTSTWAGGGQPGFMGYLQRFTDDRVTVIVLSNLQNAPIEKIANDLSRLYFGIPTPAVPKVVSIESALLNRYVGVYELYPGVLLHITRGGDGLMLRQSGGPPGPAPAFERLLATSADTFLGEDAKIVFSKNGREPASSLSFTILHLRTERTAPRIADFKK